MNLFALGRAAPRFKTLAVVPPKAFVLPTTGTRMLVPRNRVARLMAPDLLNSYAKLRQDTMGYLALHSGPKATDLEITGATLETL